jgi:5,10-methylenetetrahydrofolate reductase
MKFKDILESKKFIITAEIPPPKDTLKEKFIQEVDLIKNYVDAINITDNALAIRRASALVYAYFVLEGGADPIWQITCRDRNSLALESDIIGAAALGIKNILVVTGDFPNKNSAYFPKPVWELDSVNLIGLIKNLEKGIDLQAKEIKNPPKFTVGAVVNPAAIPQELQIIKLWKKVKAGAEFIQTQPVYDFEEFKKFRERINDFKNAFEKNYRDGRILKNPRILAGIFPVTSLKVAHFLNKKLSGVKIPEKIMARLEKSKSPEKTGLEISLELIEKIKNYADGVHLMAMGSAEVIKKIALLLRTAR